MHAALLLISLLFGVPMPDTAHADPAAESGGFQEYTGLAELGARMIDLAAPALRCTTRGELLAALDAGLLGLEYSTQALEISTLAPGNNAAAASGWPSINSATAPASL